MGGGAAHRIHRLPSCSQRRDRLNALIKQHAEVLQPLTALKPTGDADSGDEAGSAPVAQEQQLYEDDEFSRSTFGHGAVFVTTTFGLPGAGSGPQVESNDAASSDDAAAGNAPAKQTAPAPQPPSRPAKAAGRKKYRARRSHGASGGGASGPAAPVVKRHSTHGGLAHSGRGAGNRMPKGYTPKGYAQPRRKGGAAAAGATGRRKGRKRR